MSKKRRLRTQTEKPKRRAVPRRRGKDLITAKNNITGKWRGVTDKNVVGSLPSNDTKNNRKPKTRSRGKESRCLENVGETRNYKHLQKRYIRKNEIKKSPKSKADRGREKSKYKGYAKSKRALLKRPEEGWCKAAYATDGRNKRGRKSETTGMGQGKATFRR